ncbi:MAG: pre-toxin TG domain-containing protein, partial [Legionella sp.]|uniref:pre-toxin TG domain-containing protein n=1 Tax=Legionella sp. TaxID=459 RepID=UPI002840814D|nr:pre-toxin TG domain-containing protein [Legionella sp.]
DNNYSPIPEGFYDKTPLTQIRDAAGKIWEDYGDEILRYGPKALGVWGSRSPAPETDTSLTTSDYLKMAGSFALDCIPIVGQLKAAEQVWSGKDLLTEARMHRGLAALGLLPGGKLAYTAFKALGKTGSKLGVLGSKTTVVEEIVQTVPNKSSPSVVAKGFQGSRDYPGIDKYRDITLKKGTIVYAGEPGVTGFFTTSSAIRRSKLDATALFEGLQVSPRNGLYRPGVTAFEIIEDTPVAFGITRANPQYGVGGLPQLYIPNYANITKPVISYPLSNRFMRGK